MAKVVPKATNQPTCWSTPEKKQGSRHLGFLLILGDATITSVTETPELFYHSPCKSDLPATTTRRLCYTNALYNTLCKFPPDQIRECHKKAIAEGRKQTHISCLLVKKFIQPTLVKLEKNTILHPKKKKLCNRMFIEHCWLYQSNSPSSKIRTRKTELLGVLSLVTPQTHSLWPRTCSVSHLSSFQVSPHCFLGPKG